MYTGLAGTSLRLIMLITEAIHSIASFSLQSRNKYDAKFQNEDSREKSKKKHKSMLNPYSKKLYALRFSYKPKFGEDEVFIAFSIPYSYSQCQYFLKEVVEKMPEIKSKKINYSRKELCKTLGGRKVDIIKITNPSK